jgi:protoporphyrinogen IX oxidase
MLWLLAFHVVSMVAWFAGLFYLPRLYVYHAVTTDAVSNERFKVMERRLYWGIMTPAAVLTLVFGGWLLLPHWIIYKTQMWMHAKLLLVALLLVYQVFCGIWMKQFQRDANTHSQRFYRWVNEVPTVFLMAIVILVIVKPF